MLAIICLEEARRMLARYVYRRLVVCLAMICSEEARRMLAMICS
jgi:hypothetical protein